MKVSTKLAAYGAGLVVVFGVAFGVAWAVIPESFVENWQEQGGSENTHTPSPSMTYTGH